MEHFCNLHEQNLYLLKAALNDQIFDVKLNPLFIYYLFATTGLDRKYQEASVFSNHIRYTENFDA